MQRRSLIHKLLLVGAVSGVGGAYLWLGSDHDHSALSTAATLDRLDQLAAGPIEKSGSWNPFQVFTHCAQSVEFSMTGFPLSESELFQLTAGRLAFATFAARGEMSHSLDEVIPGAPELAPAGDPRAALKRLVRALLDFQSFDGELKPHFAFGYLDKSDYAIAHSLHINNHLEEFRT